MKGGSIGDYIWDYYSRVIKGILGVETIAEMVPGALFA